MNDSVFRRWITIILIIAALGRIGFLLFGEVLPVMWDARRYVGASIGLISYVDQPESHNFDSTPELDRNEFNKYTDKYLQGEQIEWLYYNEFTLTEARSEIFIAGPTYPLLMAAILMISPVADFTVIRIVNIIIDLLSSLLLILIAARMLNHNIGLITGFIYALYMPFVILTAQLLLEGLTTCLFLGALYLLLKSSDQNNNMLKLLSGLLSGLLILTKPTAAYLFVPIIVWFVVSNFKTISIKNLLRQSIYFLTPVVIIFISWSSVVNMKYGSFSLRDPSYAQANLRSSSNIKFEGYDLDSVERDFWTYSIKDQILENPDGYLRLLAKKMERLWSEPANEFGRYFILPNYFWELCHKLLIMLILIGLSWLMVMNFRSGLLLLLIAGYYTSIHLIFHSLARYSLNALPILFIASAFVLYQLYKSISSKNYSIIKWLTLFLLCLYFDYQILNQLFAISTSIILVISLITIKLILIYISINKATKVIFPDKNKLLYFIAPVVAVLAIANYTYSTNLSRAQWSEYKTELTKQTTSGTRIYISDYIPPKDNEMLTAVIDLNLPAGGSQSFEFNFADSTQFLFFGQKPLSYFFYPKPTYKIFAKYEQKPLSHYRQYAMIPLNPETIINQLSQNGYLEFEISLTNDSPKNNNRIILYGNYPTNTDSIYIPAFRFTTIERYVHKNDPRIRYPVKISSDNSISYYINKDKKFIYPENGSTTDQQIQAGRFNMYLVHFYPDGTYRVY